MTFQDLQLLPQLLRAVAEMGYAAPSPIQAQAIPPVLAGRDLIGCAQTGTGKTAAFAIPILQTLQSRVDKTHRPIRALVLTPTRELALQIKENFDLYGKYLPIRNTVIFGGVGQGPQVERVVRVPKFLYAPVEAGEQVGEICWYLEGQLLGSAPLTAAGAAPLQEKAPSLWERLFG